MDTGQQTLIKLDSSPEKSENLAASLSLPETAEEKKKLRTVGFYELNVLQTPKDNKDPEDTVKSAEVKDDVFLNKEDGDSGQMGTKDGTQPHEDKDQSPVYFDQALPTSPKPCRKHSSPTCLCKECVENYINLCEEKKEETDVNDQESDELLTSEDSASDHSNRSRSDSDGSRQTISSEEYTCHAQVTLPYPDNGKPPECITRLSNAGLYEPNEDVLSKGNEEDKISQVASTAFFVQHPEEKSMQKKSVQLEQEKVDIERGEPECEPLLRNLRRGGDGEYANPSICQWSTGCLKILGSFVASMIIFPAFLYAAYAWLPFDAPLMPDIPTRLVYTLRCASFASFPIILGVIIHGVSRLCASSYDPFKPREREVTIHRRFIKQGTFLFVLYFFNLAVLSTYLPQDHLKFIPLLTCLFALAQLLYWLSFAISRPFRSFGYGLTFLPLLAMMVSNLYFMFVVEPEKMVFLGHRNVPKN
ncbi:transmembrane protein 79 [Hyperolius riggenbachi]|uniref:transmembrane protein 79 n=1 Tax=Hyperolius riggenbachi TaxID=752182 RepID=UPI0035A39922